MALLADQPGCPALRFAQCKKNMIRLDPRARAEKNGARSLAQSHLLYGPLSQKWVLLGVGITAPIAHFSEIPRLTLLRAIFDTPCKACGSYLATKIEL